MVFLRDGYLEDPATGVTSPIKVTAKAPNTLKDSVIGGVIVLVGIAYLTATAFINGANRYSNAYIRALTEVDAITWDGDGGHLGKYGHSK